MSCSTAPERLVADSDGLGPRRQRPFAAAVEQAFLGQLGLERLEPQGEVAEARRLEGVDVQLVDTLCLEHVHAPVRHQAEHPVRGWKGMAIRSSRKIMQRTWARSSLSVK